MRIDATLEALYKVKNLTLDELTALLEAVNEKVKSSTDFSQQEKTDFFLNFADDLLEDCKYFQQKREAVAARQAADDASDPKFAHYGDQTYADVER